MTRISFYILKGDDETSRQQLACRLAAKAYYQQKQIYIHTDNAQQAEQLNTRLWSFKADSFIPHALLHDDPDCPVLIGSDHDSPPRLMDVLINFGLAQPLFFSQFERVAEFINDNAGIKAAGRQRYQFYKSRGYEISHHHL